ncbi:MAG: hypothetical protein JSV34_07015, partial [Candidatus Omnitrophota bacterium]
DFEGIVDDVNGLFSNLMNPEPGTEYIDSNGNILKDFVELIRQQDMVLAASFENERSRIYGVLQSALYYKKIADSYKTNLDYMQGQVYLQYLQKDLEKKRGLGVFASVMSSFGFLNFTFRTAAQNSKHFKKHEAEFAGLLSTMQQMYLYTLYFSALNELKTAGQLSEPQAQSVSYAIEVCTNKLFVLSQQLYIDKINCNAFLLEFAQEGKMNWSLYVTPFLKLMQRWETIAVLNLANILASKLSSNTQATKPIKNQIAQDAAALARMAAGRQTEEIAGVTVEVVGERWYVDAKGLNVIRDVVSYDGKVYRGVYSYKDVLHNIHYRSQEGDNPLVWVTVDVPMDFEKEDYNEILDRFNRGWLRTGTSYVMPLQDIENSEGAGLILKAVHLTQTPLDEYDPSQSIAVELEGRNWVTGVKVAVSREEEKTYHIYFDRGDVEFGVELAPEGGFSFDVDADLLEIFSNAFDGEKRTDEITVSYK